jgi:hypothetical protein
MAKKAVYIKLQRPIRQPVYHMSGKYLLKKALSHRFLHHLFIDKGKTKKAPVITTGASSKTLRPLYYQTITS